MVKGNRATARAPDLGSGAGTAEQRPVSAPALPTALVVRYVCPFCGAINVSAEGACPQCTMENSPAGRRATKARIGPWYVLQKRNPSAPGMKFETLLGFVRRGRIKPGSVVRGPTTHQLWRFAGHVRGLSREFELCYSCGGSITAATEICPKCNRPQDPPANPDAFLEGSDNEASAVQPRGVIMREIGPSDQAVDQAVSASPVAPSERAIEPIAIAPAATNGESKTAVASPRTSRSTADDAAGTRIDTAGDTGADEPLVISPLGMIPTVASDFDSPPDKTPPALFDPGPEEHEIVIPALGAAPSGPVVPETNNESDPPELRLNTDDLIVPSLDEAVPLTSREQPLVTLLPSNIAVGSAALSSAALSSFAVSSGPAASAPVETPKRSPAVKPVVTPVPALPAPPTPAESRAKAAVNSVVADADEEDIETEEAEHDDEQYEEDGDGEPYSPRSVFAPGGRVAAPAPVPVRGGSSAMLVIELIVFLLVIGGAVFAGMIYLDPHLREQTIGRFFKDEGKENSVARDPAQPKQLNTRLRASSTQPAPDPEVHIESLTPPETAAASPSQNVNPKAAGDTSPPTAAISALPITSNPPVNTLTNEQMYQRVRTLWFKVIDAEAAHDYKQAVALMEEIRQYPRDLWPGGAGGLELKLSGDRARVR